MQSSDNNTLPGTTSSSIPVLGEGFSQSTSPTSPISTQTGKQEESDPKKRFWQLSKKKGTEQKEDTAGVATQDSSQIDPSSQPQAMASPASPGRQPVSPPRIHSPADSQIFERNVQEDSVAVAASPAIPSHIATENHIPPVLDASSMAITDDHLSPDIVEIVTHAAHLPAAAAMTGSIHAESTLSSPTVEDTPIPQDGLEEQAPSYAALDSADIRRLSFISFADVVHGEQAADGSMRDSLLLSGASSIASPGLGARSPSPIRSPISPTIGSTIERASGLESSPSRVTGPGSPKSLAVSMATTSSPIVTGELAIETMRQSLRKVESGDLGAATRGSITAL